MLRACQYLGDERAVTAQFSVAQDYPHLRW